jgi:hypothetical protein
LQDALSGPADLSGKAHLVVKQGFSVVTKTLIAGPQQVFENERSKEAVFSGAKSDVFGNLVRHALIDCMIVAGMQRTLIAA